MGLPGVPYSRRRSGVPRPSWNAKPVERVRDVMRFLSPDSVGHSVDLGLLRGGAPTALRIVIGERAVA
jgi:S1-C subfamily serine protease